MDELTGYQHRRLELADILRAALHLARGRGDQEAEEQARQLLVRLAEDRFQLALVGQFRHPRVNSGTGVRSSVSTGVHVDRRAVVVPRTAKTTAFSCLSRAGTSAKAWFTAARSTHLMKRAEPGTPRPPSPVPSLSGLLLDSIEDALEHACIDVIGGCRSGG